MNPVIECQCQICNVVLFKTKMIVSHKDNGAICNDCAIQAILYTSPQMFKCPDCKKLYPKKEDWCPHCEMGNPTKSPFHDTEQ